MLYDNLKKSQLPKNWSELHAPLSTQRIGTLWLRKNSALGLRIPSVILPDEWNMILNPLHASFSKIKIVEAKELKLDSRIKT